MKNFASIHELPVWLIALIVFLSIWDIIWKMVAMWKSARNNHSVWFILLGIINSVGILPIVYLLLNRKK